MTPSSVMNSCTAIAPTVIISFQGPVRTGPARPTDRAGVRDYSALLTARRRDFPAAPRGGANPGEGCTLSRYCFIASSSLTCATGAAPPSRNHYEQHPARSTGDPARAREAGFAEQPASLRWGVGRDHARAGHLLVRGVVELRSAQPEVPGLP